MDVFLSISGSSGKGAGKAAPKPYWAYRGAKQSEKAGKSQTDWSSHPVGHEDGWGGRYVEGGYKLGDQFFPLPGSG